MHNDDGFDDLVTIGRFSFPYQAHLLAGSLEAEGIQSFIHGENMNSVYPFLVNDNNGIHVQVRESEAEAARAIMKRIEETASPSEDLPAAVNVDGKVYHLVRGNCPECNEASIYLYDGNSAAVLGVAALVFAITVPIKIDANYICYNCEYSWKS